MSLSWMPETKEYRFYVCPDGKASGPLRIRLELSSSIVEEYRRGVETAVKYINKLLIREARRRHRVKANPDTMIATLSSE